MATSSLLLVADRPCLTPCRTAKMGYRSLSLYTVHSMVTAGERNPSLAAQSSHKGFVQREMEPEEPCLTFFNRAPEATQPQSHHLHPIQPAQRIGAETRALEGAGQSSVRTCGVGGIVVVSCGICRLQNPLPRCFLNSASTLANASPHHNS